MLRQESIDGGPAFSRMLLYARYRFDAVWAHVLAGSIDLTRIGLVVIALGFQTAVLYSPGHFRPASDALDAVFVPSGTLVSLALCLVATLPSSRLGGKRLRRAIGVFALAILPVLAVAGFTSVQAGFTSVLDGSPYTNDGAAMDLYGARQVLQGHNPYQTSDIVSALADINAPASTVTPLMLGQFRGAGAYPSDEAIQTVFLNVLRHQPGTIPPEFESKYNYPAGSFLIIAPFLWAGINDMRFLYALAIIAAGWYLFLRLPRSLRPLAPLIVLADAPLLALTAGGQPDPVYGLFLLFGFAQWERPRLSPLFMGLAIATKQLAWFFLPFYLLLVARKLGWREAGRRSILMAVIFLLLNGPFIVQSPLGYVSGIAAPMTDPMFPLGVGVIALFVSNLIPMLPKAAFAAAELVAWAGGIAVGARWRSFGPAAGIILGAIPLFFAWRSLVNYFYLVPLFTLAIIFTQSTRQRDGSTSAFQSDVAA